MFLFCRDGVRIIPEVQSVDILIGEPKAQVVRMVDRISGTGLYGESPGDDLTVGRIDGIKHRLLERIRINKFGKWLAAGSNSDLMRMGISFNPNINFRMAARNLSMHRS